MRKYFLMTASIFTMLFAGQAMADQWSDLYSDPAATPMLNGHPDGTATNIVLRGVSGSCTNPSLVPAISSANGVSCNHAGAGVDINLNQFARQDDLLAVQSNVDTLVANMGQFEKSLHAVSTRADQGVSMSFAMAGVADLQNDEHFAVSANWGTYNGENSAAFGAAYRISDHASVNGGIATSFQGGSVGARAGIRFGW